MATRPAQQWTVRGANPRCAPLPGQHVHTTQSCASSTNGGGSPFVSGSRKDQAMSDHKSDPSGDILRGLTEEHEDQPGDIGETKTDKNAEPEESAPGPSS